MAAKRLTKNLSWDVVQVRLIEDPSEFDALLKRCEGLSKVPRFGPTTSSGSLFACVSSSWTEAREFFKQFSSGSSKP